MANLSELIATQNAIFDEAIEKLKRAGRLSEARLLQQASNEVRRDVWRLLYVKREDR